ncbi:MAG: hypothetical protein NMK33_03510 [Candidatus Cardinium sp.]|nr:MAG: hypothetical protein NMK33_03510 [Candidatus Cardinium sp.]
MKKPVMAIIPLVLLVASSCPSEKQKNQVGHPKWAVWNISEDNLDKEKCTITKCGFKALRFHPAPHQTPFKVNDFFTKFENNIIGTNSEYWVLTPNFYGSLTKKNFPKTLEAIKHRFNDNGRYNKEDGVPEVFFKELLDIELNRKQDPDPKQAIFIISTGIGGKLGVSESLKKFLKDKEKNGEILGYITPTTQLAIEKHNSYVKEGKKVYTFIHTAG